MFEEHGFRQEVSVLPNGFLKKFILFRHIPKKCHYGF